MQEKMILLRVRVWFRLWTCGASPALSSVYDTKLCFREIFSSCPGLWLCGSELYTNCITIKKNTCLFVYLVEDISFSFNAQCYIWMQLRTCTWHCHGDRRTFYSNRLCDSLLCCILIYQSSLNQMSLRKWLQIPCPIISKWMTKSSYFW